MELALLGAAIGLAIWPAIAVVELINRYNSLEYPLYARGSVKKKVSYAFDNLDIVKTVLFVISMSVFTAMTGYIFTLGLVEILG